jgi:hypothetical protein
VATTFKPVKDGAQMAWLFCRSTGEPPAKTLVAEVSHLAVLQGGIVGGGGGGMQVAMVYVESSVTTGWPLTRTLGLDETGWATPRCMHSTVAPRCRIKLEIRSPPMHHH